MPSSSPAHPPNGAVRVHRRRENVGLLVLGHCCQAGQERHPAPHQGVAADHGAEAGATTVANWPALPCAVLIPMCARVQAALVPEGKPNGEPSVLSVQVGAQATKFVLCHLAPGKCEQWAMDLGFSADEEVTLFLTRTPTRTLTLTPTPTLTLTLTLTPTLTLTQTR